LRVIQEKGGKKYLSTRPAIEKIYYAFIVRGKGREGKRGKKKGLLMAPSSGK